MTSLTPLIPIMPHFEHVLIPELNTGQLNLLIRAKYGIATVGLNKIKGRPFATTEIQEKIEDLLS